MRGSIPDFRPFAGVHPGYTVTIVSFQLQLRRATRAVFER